MINDKQFGFRGKHSTVDALVELAEIFRMKKKSRELLLILFLD